MNYEQLFGLIQQKRSFLCVGLDSDPEKLPLQHKPDGLFEFNKAIVDATLPYTVAYKPNLAFYEALGTAGWESLEKPWLISGRNRKMFLLSLMPNAATSAILQRVMPMLFLTGWMWML